MLGFHGGSVLKKKKKKKKKKICLPTEDMHVRSLGQEDPLEKEMTIYSSILAWEIPWVGKPSGLHRVTKELDTT